MGQQSIHESALRQFDTFLQSRRERLCSVVSGMPRIMWYTVALGALINMIFLWLFDLKLGNHLLLGGLVSFFMATMVRLIAILDNPFRGEVGVSPEAFQLAYQQMLQDYSRRAVFRLKPVLGPGSCQERRLSGASADFGDGVGKTLRVDRLRQDRRARNLLLDALNGAVVAVRRDEDYRHVEHLAEPPSHFDALAAAFKTHINHDDVRPSGHGQRVRLSGVGGQVAVVEADRVHGCFEIVGDEELVFNDQGASAQ
jgi:hypothetical protein